MKTISTILFLLLSTVAFSQEEVAKATFNESKITSLIYSVDSIKELKSINWDDVKEIFNQNENKEEYIVLGFNVKDKEKESEFKNTLEVKGKLSDLDGTIEIAKKMIRVIEKIK